MSRRPFAFVTKQGQVVRADVLERYALKQDPRSLEDPFAEEVGEGHLSNPPYNPEALVNLLEQNTYHYRAVRTKARDAAGLGVRVVPAPGSGDTEQDEEADAEREALEQWLQELDPPLNETLERSQFDFEATGWGVLEITQDITTGHPKQIKHVLSKTVRRHKSGKAFLQRRGSKKVWFRKAGTENDVHHRTGQIFPMGSLSPQDSATDMLWWSNYHPRSEHYGLPDIIPALGAILGDVSRRDYNISFFGNYGVPAYAVFITGDFDPGEPALDPTTGEPSGPTPLEESIEKHFQSLAENPHSVMVLSIPTSPSDDLGGDGGKVEVEIKPLAVDVKDAAFRMYRTDNRDEVLSAHGVPPYRVGIAETGSLGGTTAEEATSIYKESVVEPRQQLLESVLNRHIVRRMFGITRWVLKLEELDTTDPQQDLTMLSTLFTLGAVTPKQIAQHFSARFGIDMDSMDHPALNAHYIGGQPVDVQMQDFDLPTADVASTLNALQERLAAEAQSGNGNGNGHVDAAVLAEVQRIVQELNG